jgi:hypothetical protein
MSLADWERNGWLTAHRTSQSEIRDLLAVVDRDLADSAAENLSADWRMNIAYMQHSRRRRLHSRQPATGPRGTSITTA